MNDQVRLINPDQVYDGKFVEIAIDLTYDPIVKSDKYFVNLNYLSAKKIDYKDFAGKFFVVINVATETLRVYERQCADNSCPHKMILESEVVVGEDVDHPKEAKGKGRSILGSYRLMGWSKFYQDPEGHYPAWYKDGYPDTPTPSASWGDWFSKKVMPLDEKGKHVGTMRGAFGWYTAFVEPEPFGQWLHGTIGWGSDKDFYIKKVKKPLINIISDPRSSGCTRNNNESIAFLRKILDVGSPIIKIYAKEEYLDPTLKNYPNKSSKWEYVLTKSKNHAIDRNDVIKNLNISLLELESFWTAKKQGGGAILDQADPLNQVIEVGTYFYDTHPDVVKYTPGERLTKFGRKLGMTGNVYGIKSTQMHGSFYVDAGLLKDYAHPDTVLESSGFEDETTPPWMEIKNLKFLSK